MRSAITGYGIVSSLGVGIESFRAALHCGRQNFTRLTGIPTPHDKDLFALSGWPESVDRSASMALAAIKESLEVAGCDLGDGGDIGLIVGTVWGDTQSAEAYYSEMVAGTTPSRSAVEAMRAYPAGSICDRLGTALNIRGPRLLFSNACASGNIALGQALDLIRQGKCRVVLVVGVDRFSLTGLWGAERSGFVGRQMRPFDRNRAGTILGEGAAALVLEADGHDAGERAQAWLEGYACVCEPGAAAITFLEDGIGLQMSMRRALSDAGRSVSQIDYVNAHAPGTPLIDLVECRAIAAVWDGQTQYPAVNSTKSMTGHMSGASAMADAIAVILQMNDHFVHGNVGLEQPDERLPIMVAGAGNQDHQPLRSISNACGGGGLNTSVVITDSSVEAAQVSRAEAPRVVLTGFGELQAAGRAEGEKELDWFDVSRWVAPETNVLQLNRSAQLGGAAGVMAVTQARLRTDEQVLPVEEVAVIGGGYLGGWPAGSAALCEGLQYRPVQIFPSTALDNGCHLASVVICRQFGFTGSTFTVCGSIASGLQALAVGHDLLRCRRGRAAVVLAYDTDHFLLRRAASWMPECGPLQGFVEGAAGLVLEREDIARARGATVRAVFHSVASISGSLESESEVQEACALLLKRLQPPAIDRVILCAPADAGMRSLAERLRGETGARLQAPKSTHSLAAEALFAVGRNIDDGATLVLAGDSGGSQVGVIVCRAAAHSG
jgi:3-oxoacyl-[acyl-carrier-protein] synthase II